MVFVGKVVSIEPSISAHVFMSCFCTSCFWREATSTGIRIVLDSAQNESYIWKPFEQQLYSSGEWSWTLPKLTMRLWKKKWPGDYREQIQLTTRAELELGTSGLRIQRSSQSATLLPPLDTIHTCVYKDYKPQNLIALGSTQMGEEYSKTWNSSGGLSNR